MTGPVNDGFREGRSGLRVSPSPERFEPITGREGEAAQQRRDAIHLPAADEVFPPNLRLLPVAERQLVGGGDAGLAGDVNADGPQSRRRSLRSRIICAWLLACAPVSPEFMSRFFDQV